jgi:parallel beta-helix repeat protein
MFPRKAAGLAAAVAALAALAAGPAHAAVLHCGDTITQDTRLDADVGPCTNSDGVVIGAPNVKLDLHGHRVFATDHVGDGVRALALGATVTNGRIENFDNATELGQDATASRLAISGSNLGVFALGPSNPTITRNRISNVIVGIEPDAAPGAAVTRNRVSHCRDGIVNGAAAGSGGNNLVDRNLITDCTGDGINWLASSGDALTGNRALRNGGDGLFVAGVPDMALLDNRAENNGDDGIEVQGPAGQNAGNRAKRNADQQCIGLVCRS